ncbi:MAG: adenylate/guanylate cyclase domain-containing protein [Actinomycetota bacterium]
MPAPSKRGRRPGTRLLRATPLALASRLLDLGTAHRKLLERFAQRGTITILFTDIANFTATTESGGERAAMKLLDIHDATVIPAIARHRGRVVKNIGDGIMAAFRDPRDAVAAAIAIMNRTGRDGKPLPLRIGLDSGRPTRRGEDYIGHTVNVAARLVKRARAGEALVTDAVYKAARDVEGAVWRERGRPALKGVTKPPATWRLGVPRARKRSPQGAPSRAAHG